MKHNMIVFNARFRLEGIIMFSGVVGEVFVTLRQDGILVSVFVSDGGHVTYLMVGVGPMVVEFVIVHDKIIVFGYFQNMEAIRLSWSSKLQEQIRAITIAQLPESAFVYQGISNQLSVFMNNETIALPIRKEVLQLSSIGEDKILLLTRYNLICFDFLSNEETFSIEFENAQQLHLTEQYLYVVSGSDLFCYDHSGQQRYVNHLPDNIASITTIPTEPGLIVVAFADLNMSRYKDANIAFEYSKIVGVATSLCWVGSGVVVGTKEGTIAYYESKKSKWKAKSSHTVLKILNYQTEKILVGRQNGSVELRQWNSGGTVCKIQKQQKIGQRLVNIFFTDFRKEGYEQLICVGEGGTVKAYHVEKTDGTEKKPIVAELKQMSNDTEDLARTKAELTYAVSQLKNALNQDQEEEGQEELVSPEFRLTASLEYKNGLVLIVSCQKGFISGLSFQQAIMPITCDKKQEIQYVFKEENEKVGQINCEVLIHSIYSAKVFEVRPITIILPRFWKWGIDPQQKQQIQGKVKFKMIERNARYLKWLKQCFFINLSEKEEEKLENSPSFKVRFSNWYEKKELQIYFGSKEGRVEICCDCLKTMGDLVQDLVNYVGVKDLNSELIFPKEKENIRQMLGTIERLSQTKVSISSEVAEAINTIKFLLVKGESARSVGSMKQFRLAYGQIMTQNRNLLAQTEKKNMNTKILSDALKSVGQFINQTANVRFGEPKTKVINECREAIKKKDFPKILQLMQRGIEN